jgi:Reverse transcriptase (RNA-dependent DNA polymerase)
MCYYNVSGTSFVKQFQRMMQRSITPFTGLLHNVCEVYLDDCIIYADSEEQYLERLKILFQRFSEKGTFLQPEKYHFSLESVEYLRHDATVTGYTFFTKSREKILNFLLPQEIRGLEMFLESWQRGFVVIYLNIQ